MNVSSFNWVDYTILAMLAFSTLVSFLRGFVREAISLAIWIAALWLAYRYCHQLGEQFLPMVNPAGARPAIAFFAIAFIVLLAGAFFNYLISRFVTTTGLSGIDRVLGLAFGFARGVLLIAVIVLSMGITAVSAKPWWTDSQLIPQFAGVADWLKSFVPEQFAQLKQMAERQKSALPGSVSLPSVGNNATPSETTSQPALSPEITLKLAPTTPQPPAATTTTTTTTTVKVTPSPVQSAPVTPPPAPQPVSPSPPAN